MLRQSYLSNISAIQVSKSRVLEAWSAELFSSRGGLTRTLCFAHIVCGLKNFSLMSLETMVLQLSRCLAYLVSAAHLERLHRLACQDTQ